MSTAVAPFQIGVLGGGVFVVSDATVAAFLKLDGASLEFAQWPSGVAESRPLRASSVHRAQLRFDPGEKPTSAPGAFGATVRFSCALAQALGEFPGTFAEKKRYGVSVRRGFAREGDSLREQQMQLLEVETGPHLR
jgi:hypothetical protein